MKIFKDRLFEWIDNQTTIKPFDDYESLLRKRTLLEVKEKVKLLINEEINKTKETKDA